MKSRLPALLCLALSAALAAVPAQANCTLQKLAPQDGKISAGATTITLGEADQPAAPTAWQGPLKAGACSFDIGIIEQPMALTPDQLMYVTTYSGSLRTVTLFDLKSCSVRWKSEPFAGKVALNTASLTLGPKKVALNAQCVPGAGRKRK